MSLGIGSIKFSWEMRVSQTLSWSSGMLSACCPSFSTFSCKTFLPTNIKPLLFFQLDSLLTIHVLSHWTGFTMPSHTVRALTPASLLYRNSGYSSLCATQSYLVSLALYAEDLFTTWCHKQSLWVLFDYNNDDFSNTVTLGSTTQSANY